MPLLLSLNFPVARHRDIRGVERLRVDQTIHGIKSQLAEPR
jgi:hypothetical protein